MSSPYSVSRVVNILDSLKDVSACERNNQKVQQLVGDATRVLEELHSELKNVSLIWDLVALVRAKDWKRATVLQKKFLAGAAQDQEEFLEEVLALICKDGLMWNWGWESAIEWVEHLDAELQPKACEALYEMIKAKDLNREPHVLMLLEYVMKFSINIQDNVRADLQSDVHIIIGSIVKQIQNGDYNTCIKREYLVVLEFFVPNIVRMFDVSDFANLKLLICYAKKINPHVYYQVSLCIIDTLLKTFEENLLLESEHALHLWAHSLNAQSRSRSANLVSATHQKLFKGPMEKLKMMKADLLLYYQYYVEDKDKQNIKDLHNQYPDFLSFIVSDFINWYFNGDSKRTQNLYAIVEASPKIAVEVLKQMHAKIIERGQIHTFEAFYLFIKFKKYDPAFFLPKCVSCLLNSSNNHLILQVVNKCFQARLGVQHERPWCFVSTRLDVEKQLCRASVDQDTALTRFLFKSHANAATSWEMNAQPDGVVRIIAEGKGTQWMIKHVDNQHVKIFTKDDKFLTAVDPCQEDEAKQVVRLMKENDSDKQLWRISQPVVVKMETDAPSSTTRKRTRDEASLVQEM